MDKLPIGHKTMSSALPHAENYHRWIGQLLLSVVKGRTLEIGFGYGQYTRQIAKKADFVMAADIDADLVEKAIELAPNVNAIQSDIASPDFVKSVEAESFDAVVCINVLEHIVDDRLALTNMFNCLKPGGKLFLLVPAHPALYGPLDTLAGHIRRYNRKSIQNVLSESHFSVLKISFFNPVGGLGWWVNSKVLRPDNLSAPIINRQILVYDRFILPVSRFLNPLFRGFFGQSLWTIAKRLS